MTKPEDSHIVYIALGANLNDRRAQLAAAIERLRAHLAIVRISSLYETEPAYVSDQPRYLNAVLCARTTLTPLALLAFIKSIERALGRSDGPRFGPRPIDLDILLFDTLQIDTPELTIPHPRMAERPFVLTPLAEIAPELVPPGWDINIGALAAVVHGHGDIIACAGQIT